MYLTVDIQEVPAPVVTGYGACPGEHPAFVTVDLRSPAQLVKLYFADREAVLEWAAQLTLEASGGVL